MRLSHILNLALVAAGAAAAVPALRRRQAWEQANRRAYIVLDYDDAQAVGTRAGLSLSSYLAEARRHGATHVSLPELTLARLIAKGRLLPTVAPFDAAPPLAGRWHFLTSSEPALLEQVQQELSARVPGSVPRLLAGKDVPVLALAGDWPTLAEMGLGFDVHAAAQALEAGLGLVPRPVSFAWPEAHLVERTLLQAAGLHTGRAQGNLVAFDGDLILGHEMHLDATVDCLRRYGLTYAYFAETRHQKGDWFAAKRLAARGQVVLAHYFTPAALVPEDYHSAAHHWGMLARTRGVRLCYVNVFRRLHATDPLESLKYLAHIRSELLGLGLMLDLASEPVALSRRQRLEQRLSGAPDDKPAVLAAPGRTDLALAGLAPAGAAALAASAALRLPEPAALGLAAAAALGAAALPYLDRPRGRLEESYPPAYAPKLLALAGAAAAPAAAALLADGSPGGAAAGALVQSSMALALAAFTSGQDYQMRVEAYRSYNLDWALPLGAVLAAPGAGRWRWLALAGLGAAWLLARARTPDLLGDLDRDLPSGHTHHLSAAQRVIGDAVIALGPRPGRKWAGVGLAGLAAAGLLQRLGQPDLARLAGLTGVAANALMLAAFRQPERPLAVTGRDVGRVWMMWGAVAAALLAVPRSNAP
jgi:hypothetical protein